MLFVIIWLAWSTVGSLVAFWFLFRWGWGDATWGDPAIHPGDPNDEWHVKRRWAFYAVAFFASAMNPITLALFATKVGRKVFRAGVKSGSPEVYKRWFG